jgi:hypothetical protein
MRLVGDSRILHLFAAMQRNRPTYPWSQDLSSQEYKAVEGGLPLTEGQCYHYHNRGVLKVIRESIEWNYGAVYCSNVRVQIPN